MVWTIEMLEEWVQSINLVIAMLTGTLAQNNDNTVHNAAVIIPCGRRADETCCLIDLWLPIKSL